MHRLISLFLLCVSCQGQLRIASLNIAKRYGRNVVAEIQAEPDLRKADILLLQEVVDGPKFHMASEVASALGLEAVFAPAFQLNPEFQEGLAILSRYPLSGSMTIRLAHHELHFHTRKRIALSVIAHLPSGEIRMINTHLDNRINADAKRDQLTAILDEADRTTEPCVIGGDFNDGNFLWKAHVLPLPGLQSLHHMVDEEMEHHRFHTLRAGLGTLHFLGLKLDWIYVRERSAKNSGVTHIAFSDHNSVWVEI